MVAIVIILAILALFSMALLYNLHEEDKKREQQSAAAPSHPAPNPQQLQQYQGLYGIVGNALIDCVRANWNNCGLAPPRGLAQHTVVDEPWFRIAQDGRVAFIFVFKRSTVGGHMSHNITYNTIPAEQIVSILNDVLPNYTIRVGLSPFKIIAAKNRSNGRVCFAVAEEGFRPC